uniref:Putative Octopamine receptor type 2 n=1 Tax=Cupiennius salei TaxID=6928 RepID=T1E1B3_CUPSA
MAENSSHFPNGSSSQGNGTYLYYGDSVVVPLSVIMVITIILAIGGNIMVILTILRHRGMRTRTNMFIVNLAVADILVAALDMPVSLVTVINGDWIFGEAMCQLNAFTMALFLICSIHTLMYISIHKYISITRPFSRAMTPRRIKIMIAASWLWAAFCALGPICGWNYNLFKKGSSQCGPQIPSGLSAKSHSLLITSSNYVLPLCVMSFCYYRIFCEIHVHMKRIRQTSNIDLKNSVQQQKKVATTLFLVLSCFLLCWTPFVLYSNAAVFIADKEAIPPILNPLAYWCGYLNSACNPVIYAFRSPSFRKGYKEIMCGSSGSGLHTVNSLSFRSRSARGSLKSTSNSNAVNVHENLRRQRTMLSQTSWRSLPLIPSLVRSLSSKQSERSSAPDSPQSQDSPVISGCRICGLCGPKSSSYEPGNTDEGPSRKGSIPSRRASKALQDIREDEEHQSIEEKDRIRQDTEQCASGDAVEINGTSNECELTVASA